MSAAPPSRHPLARARRVLGRLVSSGRRNLVVLARKSVPLQRRLRIGGSRARGVNLVGYIRAEMGLGEAARGYASALDRAGIPFGITNFDVGNRARHTDTSWAHKEVRHVAFDTSLVCVNPDNRHNLKAHVSRSALAGPYLIGSWVWELPELPDGWLSELSFYDEVWVPSRFVQESVERHACIPVALVPYVVQVRLEDGFSRQHFGLPDDRFLFLSMADTHSFLERKNPLGVIRGFKQAFGGSDPRVGLVLKFNNPDFSDEYLRRVEQEREGCTNIFFVSQILTRAEVNALVALTDCFVSLHRSEGFGLGPAEAMYLGKPTILTNWSGNTDYMTPDNCAGIDYQLVRLGRDYGPYGAHQHWADPDSGHAAHWMKRLVEEPGLASDMGRRGQETIRTHFSAERVGDLISQRLRQIRRAA